jgi:hypothetical protein
MPNDKSVLTDEERIKLHDEMRKRVNKIINKPTDKTPTVRVNGRTIETAKPLGDDDFDLPSKTCDNFHVCESCQ